MAERRYRRWIAAAMLGALSAGAGCDELACVDLACADRTEIYFEEPILLEGTYRIEGTGTGGVPIDCAFTVVRSGAGGLLVEDSTCAASLLPTEGPDAGHRPQLDGFAVPARISSALLTVRHDGVTRYDGQATLEGTRAEPGVCDCTRPVLRAQ